MLTFATCRTASACAISRSKNLAKNLETAEKFIFFNEVESSNECPSFFQLQNQFFLDDYNLLEQEFDI